MTNRRFTDHQRLQMAQEMFAGKTRKQVAFDWGISRTCLDEIFNEYIERRMVWKAEKKYQDMTGPTSQILGLEHETSNSKNP